MSLNVFIQTTLSTLIMSYDGESYYCYDCDGLNKHVTCSLILRESGDECPVMISCGTVSICFSFYLLKYFSKLK